MKNPNHDQELYKDEDGIASAESMARFSNKLQFIIIFAVAVIGLGLSIANVVYTIIEEKSRAASTDHHLVKILLLVPDWVRLHRPNRTDDGTC